MSASPVHCKFVGDAMACAARLVVQAIVEGCPAVFDGDKTFW